MTGQNDRQDRSLTGQVRDQAGHCPLTGRYLQPCFFKAFRFLLVKSEWRRGEDSLINPLRCTTMQSFLAG